MQYNRGRYIEGELGRVVYIHNRGRYIEGEKGSVVCSIIEVE